MRLSHLPLLLAAACTPDKPEVKEQALAHPTEQSTVSSETHSTGDAVKEVIRPKEPSLNEAYIRNLEATVRDALDAVNQFDVKKMAADYAKIDGEDTQHAQDIQTFDINGKKITVTITANETGGEYSEKGMTILVDGKKYAMRFSANRWSIDGTFFNYSAEAQVKPGPAYEEAGFRVMDRVQTRETSRLSEEQSEAINPQEVALREAMFKKLAELKK